MERVTKWYHPLQMTEGKYGRCNNLEWLEFEKKRFVELGRQAVIRLHPTIPKLYALYVNNSDIKHEE